MKYSNNDQKQTICEYASAANSFVQNIQNTQNTQNERSDKIECICQIIMTKKSKKAIASFKQYQE